jgi:hypothetical protein
MAQEGGIGIIHKSMASPSRPPRCAVKKYESGVVKDPITIQQDATHRRTHRLTRAHGISGVPVTRRRGPRGHRHAPRPALRDAHGQARVLAIMTPAGQAGHRQARAPRRDEVQRLLHQHRIEKILVVNDDFDLRGMITVKDFDKAETTRRRLQGLLRAPARRRLRRAPARTPKSAWRRWSRPASMCWWWTRRTATRATCWSASAGSRPPSRRAGHRRQHRHRRGRPGPGGGRRRCGQGRHRPGLHLHHAHRHRRRRAADHGHCRRHGALAASTTCRLIADGGIRYSGDIAKAIAAGATRS